MFLLQRFCALTTALRHRATDLGLSAPPRGWCLGCVGWAGQAATARTWSASGFDDGTPQRVCLPRRWPADGCAPVGYRTRASACLVGAGWRSPRRLCRSSRCAGPVGRCCGPARGVMACEGMRQRVATRWTQLRRAGPFSPIGVCPGSVVDASEAEPVGLSRRSGTSL